MQLGLEGKKALVFGSSGGIGKAIAESLLKENADVVINSRHPARVQAALASLQDLQKSTAAFGGRVHGIAADLTQPKEAARVVHEAHATMSGLDILVMNTGGPNKGSFEEISTEQWMLDYQNLWLSFVDSVKAVLPAMKEKKFGRILLVTSISAKEPLKNLTTSNALRAGLGGLCKSLASEVARFGITVNVVLPGYTNTDRLKELNLSTETVQGLVPMGRLGRPEELADLVAFLASERAGYITGQSIAVDGGVLRGF
ncbi:MAG: SDR family oxidoreductase [Bdellovibrionaceae bacterium]|nr:SDR family oxidoreductase [Pseudobdellovibrionaceae bacterium]